MNRGLGVYIIKRQSVIIFINLITGYLTRDHFIKNSIFAHMNKCAKSCSTGTVFLARAVSFKDHFSRQAKAYSAGRPTYSPGLFSYLAGLCKNHNTAWDCATGSGQAAVLLADHFKKVVASDASGGQIENASREKANIEYAVFTAEQTPLADQSIDLITVAQALHWFDHAAFFSEVRRVLRPDGIFAAFSYKLHQVSAEVDKIVFNFYENIVGPYWPPERKLVETSYSTIKFPFEKIDSPPFNMQLQWSSRQMLNYMQSWSSVQRYIDEHGQNPIEQLEPEILACWPEDEVRQVTWPFVLVAGRAEDFTL